MNFIAIERIGICENRQRRFFDPAKLNELRESIERIGLMHPVVLRSEGEQLFLVAGERRLKAITEMYELGGQFRFDNKYVPNGLIPYVHIGDLDPLAREEAELEENAQRHDLSWSEKAAATARLHSLRTRQAVSTSAPPPTHLDTAEEIHGSRVGAARETVRRELIVAKHMDRPEVRAAKTLDEAFKTLKRIDSLERNRELAAEIGRTFTTSAHTLLNEDSLAWMETAEAAQFDVILTDPPYGMGADEFGTSGGKAHGEHGYVDDDSTFHRCLDSLVKHAFRLAKPLAHLYVFCDIDRFAGLRSQFAATGWQVHRTPIIWHKPNGTRVPWPDSGPQRKYELVLYAVKGKRPVNNIGPDVISAPTEPNLGHSAQKPVPLLLELLKRSVRPGDAIFDPFAGTGGVLPAAHELSCRATCIEIDQAAYGIAANRLKALDAQPDLLEELCE